MSVIKNDWRSRLKPETLTALMTITLSKDTIDTFDPDSAIELWFKDSKTQRRPQTRPYGSRMRTEELSWDDGDDNFEYLVDKL